VNPEPLLARKGRPRPVSLDIWHLDAHNDESDTHTVIEATGRDQMGFLYCVTAALSEAELNIHTAKITTRGHRAIDAFYVTNAQGQKLSDEEAREAERILARLLGED